MNQQRPFFQAVISALSMCFRPIRWIAVSMALLFVSCASLTPDRIAVLAAIAGQAAQVGAQEWLVKHPEHRAAFDAISMAISALVKGGVTDRTAYAELLNALPTSTLAGPSGAVYVTEDRVNVYDETTGKAYDVSNQIQVQRAIVAGLKRACAPMPPMPGGTNLNPVKVRTQRAQPQR